MAGAPGLPGGPWQVRGLVEQGDGRGRTLGFPTANIALPGCADLPADGVYAGEYRRPDGSRYKAVISLGWRPTFYLVGGARLLEAHLLDFSGCLYGETADVEFRHWIREQRRFTSPTALARQIRSDTSAVRAALVTRDQIRADARLSPRTAG